MIYLELIFFLLFVVFTVMGYRKSNRDLMLLGAVCSVIAFAVPDAITGFYQGYYQSSQG